MRLNQMKAFCLVGVVLAALLLGNESKAQNPITLKCEEIGSAGRWNSSLEINTSEKKIIVDGESYSFSPQSSEKIVKNNVVREVSVIHEWTDGGISWKKEFHVNGKFDSDLTKRYRLNRITGDIHGPYSSGPCKKAEKLF
ncbi:hypothetical protein GFK26_12535 [Variovorax paradoxus]|uniref:DUF3757 domain-containing protein n=1 Tax=Variovorax paradoxus TaxID=34073 RepID=A0A5Q0M3Y2_VARPD|nr:hypothetical protein [Variovorax paradoxus]QFZ83527.1 hypothetical protein GFK26_12535 [Variovorax paradoxus]